VSRRFSSTSIPSNFVSLHPYFKVHAGRFDAVKAKPQEFVEKTASEKENLFYGFNVSGDEVFCRETYENANGLLAHLDNLDAVALTSVFQTRNYWAKT